MTLPRNLATIFAEIIPSGNGNEEFWVSRNKGFDNRALRILSQYFNTANEFLNDLPAGTTFGDGPFREVRFLVDGRVAGVAFPYAVIFTGGIIPSAWRSVFEVVVLLKFNA